MGKREKPGRRKAEQRGQTETESGLDNEKEAVEDQQSNDNTKNNDGKDYSRKPTKHQTKKFSKRNRTLEGGSNKDRDTGRDNGFQFTLTQPQVNLVMTKAKTVTMDTSLELVEPFTPQLKDTQA